MDEDVLGDFLKLNANILGRINPRGNILSNTWSVLTGIAGEVGEEAGGGLQMMLEPLQHINPSGNLLSNAFSLGTFGLNEAFQRMDWNFDEAPMDAPDLGAPDSSVDELGLGTENSSDPFAGIEQAVNLAVGIGKLFAGL